MAETAPEPREADAAEGASLATIVLSMARKQPMLLETLGRLKTAGWAELLVYFAAQPRGHWPDYQRALELLLHAQPDAQWYAVFEDDLLFCRALRLYLVTTLAELPVEKIALCSPYCPQAYTHKGRGWQPEWRAPNQSHLAGSQAWIFPREFAWDLVQHAVWPDGWGGDRVVGQHAGRSGRVCLYHRPSLIQHAGEMSSEIYAPHASTIRHASDFIGEDYTPWEFIGGNWTGANYEPKPY